MKKSLIFLMTFLCVNLCVFAADNRLPGDSIASARLQYDTLMNSVYPIALNIKPKCKVVKVVDTQVINYPEYNKVIDGKKYASTNWNELWILDACKTEIYVPVTFIPDKEGMGTSFVVQYNSVKYKNSRK